MKKAVAGLMIAAIMSGGVLYLSNFWTPTAPPGGPAEPSSSRVPLPVEPVKKDLRDAGGGVVPTLRPRGDTVERLPAKPVRVTKRPPKPKILKLVRPIVPVPHELTSGDVSVQLAGIVELALEQTCGSSRRPCGRQARTALRRLVRGRTTHCQMEPGTDRGIGSCRVGKRDLATWLVTQGWAEALPGSGLEPLADQAKARKVGLWAE